MEVGDGSVDLLLHFVLVASFELLDGLIDLVEHVFLVAALVSLVGLGDAIPGRLQQRQGLRSFLGGLELVERLALLWQVSQRSRGAEAQQDHEEGNFQQKAKVVFHGVTNEAARIPLSVLRTAPNHG